jgi:hypothetical protein
MATAATAATEEEGCLTLQRELEAIDFAAKKSIRYHSKKRALFEHLDDFTNWLVA